MIVKAVTSDYWKTVGAGVEQAMKTDPSITASFLGPNAETDIEDQIRIIELQISAKVDAIAVAPSQADQVQPTLEKAVAAGIPVILIDTDITGFTNKAAFVGTDNKLGGGSSSSGAQGRRRSRHHPRQPAIPSTTSANRAPRKPWRRPACRRRPARRLRARARPSPRTC